ncbi:MAG TPA: SDR family oxidoreductase [Spirochaetota bacterium]|nr:SDR family oxidoreductase [Spirochaetota bacterium]HPC41611.1 SDR family oxidoreductase [Spirochaetota bacterium]HPL15370.1 SDR family oxidoreductase [Spirochaetota bacterium]HQF08279.1 SDR family oxidoreductase [Spirochaetota bacterium]HQH97106.1 SDR family oxidoreductase [Spirochaetota bacterium]
MKRILITGSSGYIGAKLTAFLSDKQDVGLIVGLDVKGPGYYGNKFVFYERDVREPVDDIINTHSIDTVIHAAFILPPIHDRKLMEDININGTRSVLDSCVRAGVKRVLYTSSTTAYGFHPDNDRPLVEESPLRGNDDVTYSKSKKIIEGIFAEYSSQYPDISFIIIRPCFVVGPGFDNPLARFLQLKIVPIPVRTEPMQFIHEDDLVEIMWILLLRGKGGAYNAAGDGVMTIREMASALGNITLPLPYRLVYLLNNIAWLLRLTFLSEFPSPYLAMIRYSWVASCEKLKRSTGYSFRYDTRQAFADFARHIASLKN